jgi:hypothetical protein
MSRMCSSTFSRNSSSASISASGGSEPGVERQIDDAAADLLAGLLQLRDDLVHGLGLSYRMQTGSG